MEEVLQLSRESIGLEHPVTTYRMEGLAMVRSALGKHDQAEKLYSDVLAIRSRGSGRQTIDAADAMDELSAELHFRQHFAESEPLLRESLAIWEKTAWPEIGANKNTAESARGLHMGISWCR